MGTIVLLAPKAFLPDEERKDRSAGLFLPPEASALATSTARISTQQLCDDTIHQGFSVRWVTSPQSLKEYLPWNYPDATAYWLYCDTRDFVTDTTVNERWAPLEWIRKQDSGHQRPIFILTRQYRDTDHITALQHGADRYFTVNTSSTVLLAAVQAHQRTLSAVLNTSSSNQPLPTVPAPATEYRATPPWHYASPLPPPKHLGTPQYLSSSGTPAHRNALTHREQEIVVHLAKGASNSAIAEALSISPTTVKNHLAHVYKKLGVANRTEAAYFAQKLNWIQ